MKYLRPCIWALAVLWQYKTIRAANRLRLWRKSMNLFTACLAFTDRERPKEQLQRAMICALLTALYDYETDWVAIENLDNSIYLGLLKKLVPEPTIRRPAGDLFSLDLKNALSTSGLERGSLAFTFYNAVIGSTWLSGYSPREIALFGRGFQLMDDTQDLEKDRRNGHKNCFLTSERETYLAEAMSFVESDFFRQLERNSIVYRGLRLYWARLFDRMQAPDERAASDVKEEIKRHMLATRPQKYGAWFKGVAIFQRIARIGALFSWFPGLGYFEDGGRRAEAIEGVYTASHDVDDVVDGDAPVPPGFASPLEYVDHMIRVVKGREAPRGPTARLFVYSIGIARQTGADLVPNTRWALLSLRFDALRRRFTGMRVLTRRQLELSSDFCDTYGTVGGSLKIVREPYVTYKDLAELAMATRIYYTLRDLEEDVLSRLFNIPREDMEEFEIALPDYHSREAVRAWRDSEPVRRWCVKEAKRGLRLLATYRQKKRRLRLHPFTRAILFWMYERRVTSYLRRRANAPRGA